MNHLPNSLKSIIAVSSVAMAIVDIHMCCLAAFEKGISFYNLENKGLIGKSH